MQKRKWDSKQKLQVVLEGLKGRTVASICNEYQISQSVYYRWRDAFFANADKVFEARAHPLIIKNILSPYTNF